MPITLQIKGKLAWDYGKDEFIDVADQTVVLEHCLLAVARWESKWRKLFFSDMDKRTPAEIRSYISCMALNDVDPNFSICLTNEQIEQVTKYISEEQTATIIKHASKPPSSNEALSSELLYYYMSQVPLPFDICERWHLSRLFKTLEIAAIKSDPDQNKKMPAKQWASQQNALNKLRQAQMKSRG